MSSDACRLRLADAMQDMIPACQYKGADSQVHTASTVWERGKLSFSFSARKAETAEHTCCRVEKEPTSDEFRSILGLWEKLKGRAAKCDRN